MVCLPLNRMVSGGVSTMDDLFQLIDEHQQNRDLEQWEGTFRDYLKLVMENPRVARPAHERLYDMIKRAGVEVNEENNRERYLFFTEHLFGIDEALSQVMEYFKAAAFGSDVRRRVLLLYGPPSSGKSELVIRLKRGLEEYSRTQEGALYAIADCPQHEEPLHLIPHALRDRFREQLGITIEGELCPLCSLNLREKYENDIYRVPVKRIFISEKDRIGIGTFVPSDPKSQDIAELVASIDLSKIGAYGAESDPRAYRFDGELNIANRGLMECIEMLKADARAYRSTGGHTTANRGLREFLVVQKAGETCLSVLLTLAQECSIKTGRFPVIYADECIISHTSAAEFREFMSDPRSEARQA